VRTSRRRRTRVVVLVTWGVHVDVPGTAGARIGTQPSNITVNVAGMFTWRGPCVVVIGVDVRIRAVRNGMLGSLVSGCGYKSRKRRRRERVTHCRF